MRQRLMVCLILATVLFFGGNTPLLAQDGGSSAPTGATIHIVQRGETLYRIAVRYGTTVESIAQANGISDPSAITVGQRLLIPNPAPGTPGVPTEHIVTPGDTLFSLAARYGTSPTEIARINRILNPALLHVGEQLRLQEGSSSGDQGIASGWIHVVQADENLYRIGLRYSVSAEAILILNGLSRPTAIYPGQKLIVPGAVDGPTLTDVPFPFARIEMQPAPVDQGRTAVFRIVTALPAKIDLMFMDRVVGVISDESRTFHAALVGVDSFAPPGLYWLRMQATEESGKRTFFERPVKIQDGGYNYETIQLLPGQEDLLNPKITEPEAAKISTLVSPFTPQRYFGGLMGLPCPAPITSPFGTRRSYNGSGFDRIHAGTDFAAMPGAAIYAPAAGVVVMAETLNVRGNATLIDHGWGVYTGYWHQTEIKVRVGEVVQQGQVIGTVGQTGRVTGPHLHWEMFVGGVQVDPLQWTRQSFP
ncbi:MAG: LysM peptidoglycan-binding domain-containing protein [Anaerolinea sp.]|nr:LysM peptidoglycan-binding domain-containing protein [Anaerolinea sp.]